MQTYESLLNSNLTHPTQWPLFSYEVHDYTAQRTLHGFFVIYNDIIHIIIFCCIT